jgi:hypothetical protein
MVCVARAHSIMKNISETPWEDTWSSATVNMTQDGTLVHVCRWDRAEARKQLERFRQTLMKDKLHLLLLKRESAGEFANAIFFHDPQNPEGDFFIEYLFESPAERQKYHPHVREIRDQMAAKWREMASNPNAN